MSVIGTKIVETETLLFGLAELFLGDSASHEASTGAIFNSNYYFGCKVEVSFTVEKEFLQTYGLTGGVKTIKDVLLLSSLFKLDTEFIELTEKNMSYVMGGSGSDTNILDNLFSQPEALRAELVFSYPNGSDSMTLILPKVKVVTQTVQFTFQSMDPMQLPMNLTALKSTHSAWSSNPIGKIVFS